MTINLKLARRSLQEFNFSELFIEELGWDNASRQKIFLTIDGKEYQLEQIAQKRGMVVYGCSTIHEYQIRAKIDNEALKYSREHFIIYHDKREQMWQWVRREQGRPIARREQRIYANQSGTELLLQKLEAIAISFAEEENFTIVDVTSRTRRAFDVDRVTKRFYDFSKKNTINSFLRLSVFNLSSIELGIPQ